MLLEVERIQVRYGRRIAVAEVSLRVPDGALVALLGANGAGKSTTLRAISGLVQPASGSIVFGGQSLIGKPPHSIARMGIAHVPEGRGLLPSITVAENLRIGALGHTDAAALEAMRKRIFEYFPLLRQRLGEFAGVLSGGEQQMLSIARALLKNPKLLMIDEMSLGLAPRIVDELMHVIVDLAAAGMSVLCVEQNTKKVLRHAAYGYVLETGRTVMEGRGGDLLTDERVVRAYLGRNAAGTAAAQGDLGADQV